MENSKIALTDTLLVNRLIRQKEFMELLSIKKTTFHEWIKKGIIPEPIRYSARLTLWDLSMVNQAIENLKRRVVTE